MSAFNAPDTTWCPECQRERVNCVHLSDQKIATDGGQHDPDRDKELADHLEAALEAAENQEAHYHIRAALQQPAVQRGEVENEL